jgi:hypothetical protein
MPVSASAIISQANQIAKCPGYVAQAQIALNAILQELSILYDIDQQRKTTTFTVPGTLTDPTLGTQTVFDLPSDYLRDFNLFYVYNGTTYNMTAITMEEYDKIPQIQNETSFPAQYTTDLNSGVLKIFPQSSIAMTMTMRYFAMPQDMSDFTQTPWFYYQRFLIHAVATEMMKITSDQRWPAFETLGQEMLRKFLRMVNDLEGKLARVERDPRYFRSGAYAKPTKYVPD